MTTYPSFYVPSATVNSICEDAPPDIIKMKAQYPMMQEQKMYKTVDEDPYLDYKLASVCHQQQRTQNSMPLPLPYVEQYYPRTFYQQTNWNQKIPEPSIPTIHTYPYMERSFIVEPSSQKSESFENALGENMIYPQSSSSIGPIRHNPCDDVERQTKLEEVEQRRRERNKIAQRKSRIKTKETIESLKIQLDDSTQKNKDFLEQLKELNETVAFLHRHLEDLENVASFNNSPSEVASSYSAFNDYLDSFYF